MPEIPGFAEKFNNFLKISKKLARLLQII